MLISKRSYARKAPDRDAKLINIYCEGANREPEYFKYFNELSSRIKLEKIPAPRQGDNSPTGLDAQAYKDLIKPEPDNELKYNINENDEIWFVIDTDTWGAKINALKASCSEHINCNIAQGVEPHLRLNLKTGTPCIGISIGLRCVKSILA